MMQKNKYQAYAVATQTVAKTKQIVILYDGVIRLVQQAKEAIRENRIEDRYHLLVKATDIVTGLQGCLDFETGGQVARVLYDFYSMIDNRIFSIHRSNSMDTCDEVTASLRQMRDVWHEIDQNTAGGEVAAKKVTEAAAPMPAPGSVSPEQNVTLSA